MINVNIANQLLSYITAKETTINFIGSGFCYLGFSSTTPAKDGSNFTEPDSATYPSYERVQLNVKEAIEYTDVFGDVANGEVKNTKEFTTRECKEESGWPTFTHFGIFKAETGGTPLAWDWLTDPDGEEDEDGNYPKKSLTVAQNNVAVFRKETLRLKFKYDE